MRRSAYVEFNKIGFTLLWFFCDLLWFLKDLVKIKNKKREKLLPPHPQTAQGGYENGFVSLRRLDGWFCCPGRKCRFGLKLRETEMTFSKEEASNEGPKCWPALREKKTTHAATQRLVQVRSGDGWCSVSRPPFFTVHGRSVRVRVGPQGDRLTGVAYKRGA